MPNPSKTEQRKMAQGARNAIVGDIRQQYNKAISMRIAGHPAIADAKVIMSYMAFAGEVDLAELHTELKAQGKTVCFPLCGEKRLHASTSSAG